MVPKQGILHAIMVFPYGIRCYEGNSGAMESCQAFVRTLELCPMDIRAQLVQNVVICGGLTEAILSVGIPILTNTDMGISEN